MSVSVMSQKSYLYLGWWIQVLFFVCVYVCFLVSEGLQKIGVICERLKPPSEKSKKIAWSHPQVLLTNNSFPGVQENFRLVLGWLNAS